jgi:hypothetical protein
MELCGLGKQQDGFWKSGIGAPPNQALSVLLTSRIPLIPSDWKPAPSHNNNPHLHCRAFSPLSTGAIFHPATTRVIGQLPRPALFIIVLLLSGSLPLPAASFEASSPERGEKRAIHGDLLRQGCFVWPLSLLIPIAR